MPDSEAKQAKITSLRLLAASPKSRIELSKKLSRKGYRPQVIQETLDELEKQGVLNDLAYARNLILRWTQGKNSGKKKILFELKRRGVSRGVCETVLAEISPEEERRQALEAGLYRWQRFKQLPQEKRRKRVYDFLVRRGYDFELVRDLLREIELNES